MFSVKQLKNGCKISIIIMLTVGLLSMENQSEQLSCKNIVLNNLGELVLDVQKNSTYPFIIEPEDAKTSWPYYLGDKSPFILEYQHETLGFRLPLALFGALSSFVGHVVEVQTNPHLTYLTQKEALALVHELSTLFDNIGWQRTSENNPSDREILDEFKNTTYGAGFWMYVTYWRSEGVDLYIEMKLSETKESWPDFVQGEKRQDVYIVNVVLRDKAVYDHYLKVWTNRPK